MVKNLAGDCHGCCCGRGGQQGDGGGQQEVGQGVQCLVKVYLCKVNKIKLEVVIDVVVDELVDEEVTKVAE